MKNITKTKLATTFIITCLISGVALAKDDCTDPVTDWQPREKLRQKMIDKGWDVKRIKVDDGCYEVKGSDRNGHQVEAKFLPASLKIIELEVKFDGSGDASDYLDSGKQKNTEKSDTNLNLRNSTSKNKSNVTID